VQDSPYGGFETDTPGHENDNLRASGLTFLRVAVQRNAATGFNLSSYVKVRGSYMYAFGNVPGSLIKPFGWLLDLPGFRNRDNHGTPGAIFRNGLWFPFVQDAGGAGKWALLDDVVIDHYWAEANNGLGFWPDVYNKAITLRHSKIGPNRGIEFPFDAWSQVELSFGPTIIEDCLFENMLNIAESSNTIVRNCHFNHEGLITRNGDPRGGPGLGNLTVTNNTLYNGAQIRWPGTFNRSVEGNPTWQFDDTGPRLRPTTS
jgi:hypothetical protein